LKKYYSLLFLLIVAMVISGCSGKSSSGMGESEIQAEKKEILSKDEAEVLIWNTLSSEEKEKYTIDYEKELGKKYYIRVYEKIDGEIKVRGRFTVDYNTKEIKKISDN